jgi:hypothetical protein
MPEREVLRGAPWYRYFWPWFIVGLLGTAVVGSIATAVVAFSGSDSLVRDDWYKDGMAINRRFEREQRASALGIAATGRFDFVTGEVWLELSGDETGDLSELVLELSHPTRSERDTRLTLQRTADGSFRGALEAPLSGRRFYVRLEPVLADPSWRVSGPLELSVSSDFQLDPGA